MADLDLLNFVLAGFKSIPKLWNYATPELLSDEINHVSKAIIPYLDNLPTNKLPEDFAYIAGRNKAKEILQRFEDIEYVRSEKEKRVRLKEQANLEKAEKEAFANSCKQELSSVLDSLFANSEYNQTKLNSLNYFKAIYVDGLKDAEIASQFPESTRDQRYQWKARAIKLMLPLISEDCKKYISLKTKTKFAYILQFADNFYKIIGDL